MTLPNPVKCFFFYTLLCLASFACRESPNSSDRLSSKSREIPVPAFTEVAENAGLSGFVHANGATGKMYFPEQMGSGGAFVDYNGDTWLDILLVGGGPIDPDRSPFTQALRLFENNQDGTFTDVTETAGLAEIQAYGQGVTAADYDGDGDEDIYFTTLHQNYLLRNDDGVFSDVSQSAGVAGASDWSSSALFFDADLDGDLDLFVANYVDWSPGTDIFCSIQGIVIADTGGKSDSELSRQYGQKVYCPPSEFQGEISRFYRNQGDGSFQDETGSAGFLTTPLKSLGVASFDYNRDGWPDLLVANDANPDLLYKNNGDGTFEEIGQRSGIAFDELGYARAGMGIDTGVVDGSGQESIFVGNFSSEMIGVYTHAGNDQFSDRSTASRIGQPSLMTLTFGLILFDVEYDGDLDLLAANGHVWAVRPPPDGSTYRQKTQLFVNGGNGSFKEFSPTPGSVFDQLMVARGASYGDYDRDGDLDILVTENGGPVHLWRNELSDARYLRVHLQGTTSNTEGLGAQITAVAGNQRMYRRIRTGSSYLSQSEKTASFGLGDRDRVDSLIVEWPGGGVDVFTDLEVNQEIVVVQGAGRYEVREGTSSS